MKIKPFFMLVWFGLLLSVATPVLAYDPSMGPNQASQSQSATNNNTLPPASLEDSNGTANQNASPDTGTGDDDY